MIIQHVVQIVADNTDVFNGTKAEEIPRWARIARVQLVAPDTDWTYSFDIGGQELARDSGPHKCQADNLQTIDWREAHLQFEIANLRGERNIDPILNVNVVTAGVGLACIQYEG